MNSQPDADRQVVVCVVAGERYGIAIAQVLEIIRVPSITTLPGTDPGVSGVINLRGRIVTVLDLRERFGLPAAPPTRLSRIVIADAGTTPVGLVVDAVDEVLRIPLTAIDPPPPLAATGGSDHIQGIARSAEGLVILIDLERLLADLAVAEVAAT